MKLHNEYFRFVRRGVAWRAVFYKFYKFVLVLLPLLNGGDKLCLKAAG